MWINIQVICTGFLHVLYSISNDLIYMYNIHCTRQPFTVILHQATQQVEGSRLRRVVSAATVVSAVLHRSRAHQPRQWCRWW